LIILSKAVCQSEFHFFFFLKSSMCTCIINHENGLQTVRDLQLKELAEKKKKYGHCCIRWKRNLTTPGSPPFLCFPFLFPFV
jgi:hypothetical protein